MTSYVSADTIAVVARSVRESFEKQYLEEKRVADTLTEAGNIGLSSAVSSHRAAALQAKAGAAAWALAESLPDEPRVLRARSWLQAAKTVARFDKVLRVSMPPVLYADTVRVSPPSLQPDLSDGDSVKVETFLEEDQVVLFTDRGSVCAYVPGVFLSEDALCVYQSLRTQGTPAGLATILALEASAEDLS